MTTASDTKKAPTKSELKVIRKEKTKKFCLSCIDTVLIYGAVVAGVLLTESAMDLENTRTLNFFIGWSWQRFAVAAMVAGAFMTKFDHGGDLVGKRKNIKRRIGLAFGQGAALRSAVEWMALLFTLSR